MCGVFELYIFNLAKMKQILNEIIAFFFKYKGMVDKVASVKSKENWILLIAKKSKSFSHEK